MAYVQEISLKLKTKFLISAMLYVDSNKFATQNNQNFALSLLLFTQGLYQAWPIHA